MKLPADVKAKWLKALRSGNYKQTTSTMYDPKTKSFCCLGVLEHVCMNGKVETSVMDKDMYYLSCPTLRFWNSIGAEVTLFEGDRENDEQVSNLMSMNDALALDKDGARKKDSDGQPIHTNTFKTIAAYISRNVKTL